MVKKNIIATIAVAVALGIGVTAYAAAGETKGNGMQGQRLGLGRITSMKGYDYMTSVLKNKLGLSDKEIADALSSGKTPYELAIEKGMTVDSFKAAILEEKSKAIDEAVAKGTISKEASETLKANLEQNIQSCTGSFGQRQGNGNGCGGRMRGNGGQGGGCQYSPGNTK